MNDQSDESAPDPRFVSEQDAGLARRQELADALAEHPYNFILYLERASVYSDLGYPDLAAGDAYRALLLTDEVLNEGFEYHEQALECLGPHLTSPLPEVLCFDSLSSELREETNGIVANGNSQHPTVSPFQVARVASLRCFQILSLSLLFCGCLRSACNFCDRGLSIAPQNGDLLHTKKCVQQVARGRLGKKDVSIHDLPDSGLVRREVYPWNAFEPDRFSEKSLGFLNSELARIAPKCVVRVSRLPVLLEAASETDDFDIIPTCDQLGLFAQQEIAPGEVVLREPSLLTANNRLKESTCDACSAELPPLGSDSEAVSCPECYDTVFCSAFCFSQAQKFYHPAVCDKDVDVIAKDPDAGETVETLYLLLLARLLAMSNHQEIHPLEAKEVKYIWGDFLPSRTNDLNISPSAGPPPEWTLPFSFKYNVESPLHILEKMDVDIYATLAEHDLWVFNTLYSKFRSTASARGNPRDGRPDVAAVHPLWCLANHDCNPNVRWEWGGNMVLWARERRVVGDEPGGIRPGEEILNHYCDVSLPVQQRREWARGSLGGWCMCNRCRNEAALDKKTYA
jgi:SET domain